MKKIYKWALDITDTQTLSLPEGAEILSVQDQGGSLCLWAMVDPAVTKVEQRVFEIVGTGHPMNPLGREYLGTVQMRDGALVWHVFVNQP